MLQEAKEQHDREIAAQKHQENRMEAQYTKTVKVRRASAAALGKALLGGALTGAVDLSNHDIDTTVVAAAPALPSQPKPPQPDSDDESSTLSSSSSDEEEEEEEDLYEANIEAILAKPVSELTPIEMAARRSALADEEIPLLEDIVPDFNSDPAAMFEFLHAPVPYEQGIINCELHRKGKCVCVCVCVVLCFMCVCVCVVLCVASPRRALLSPLFSSFFCSVAVAVCVCVPAACFGRTATVSP